MTLRERLADWISGGALSRADARVTLYHGMNIGALQMAAGYKGIIAQIAACETPGANATVRRMARIAREALE